MKYKICLTVVYIVQKFLEHFSMFCDWLIVQTYGLKIQHDATSSNNIQFMIKYLFLHIVHILPIGHSEGLNK